MTLELAHEPGVTQHESGRTLEARKNAVSSMKKYKIKVRTKTPNTYTTALQVMRLGETEGESAPMTRAASYTSHARHEHGTRLPHWRIHQGLTPPTPDVVHACVPLRLAGVPNYGERVPCLDGMSRRVVDQYAP